MERRVSRQELQTAVQEAYELYRNDKGGKNADYIPYLARVDSNLFSIAVSLPGGEIIEAGDSSYRFGIESISKVATALLVLKEYGANTIDCRLFCKFFEHFVSLFLVLFVAHTRAPRVHTHISKVQIYEI